MFDEDTVIMYTKPADASRYWDRDGIIVHYDNVLSKIEKKWMWIFDADGFSYKHIIEIDVATSLARLISSKYSESLQKIIIINPSFVVTIMLNIVKPFLSKKIQSLIVIDG
jgi:hypothetical protein